MLYVVTGGSGSGKSAFAEDLAVKINKEFVGNHLYYLATMHAYDKESVLRIKRHRQMRKGKGFITIEQELFLGVNIEDSLYALDEAGTYLLEDLSNLLANEMYLGTHKEWFSDRWGADGLYEKLIILSQKKSNLIIVTNEIFSDDGNYDRETESFLMQLGYLNCRLAGEADGVVEVVCGIPVWQKGRLEC